MKYYLGLEHVAAAIVVVVAVAISVYTGIGHCVAVAHCNTVTLVFTSVF